MQQLLKHLQSAWFIILLLLHKFCRFNIVTAVSVSLDALGLTQQTDMLNRITAKTPNLPRNPFRRSFNILRSRFP